MAQMQRLSLVTHFCPVIEQGKEQWVGLLQKDLALRTVIMYGWLITQMKLLSMVNMFMR